MKLNLRPNQRKAYNSFIIIIITVSLQLAIVNRICSSVTCLQVVAQDDLLRGNSKESILSRGQRERERNEHPANELNNNTQQVLLRPEVKDLRLISDYRAVKLHWTFEHNDSNQPASFDVRYCELTSWNIEIKCRHKDLKVEDGKHRLESDNSVIETALPMDTVFHLDPPNGKTYEAQIYDLRALTNYTFLVRVARFVHEVELEQPTSVVSSSKKNRLQAARRLGQEPTRNQSNELARRIETKAFTAEATKCLADVSEVLVNTGRYFGGRISVENSVDPRCNLIGNRSSEQTSYLFKIDHEICESKLVEGNRIETMVLVHENKDILTHNTARFLVLCNFLQKSFTLRASVSLPKVNGMIGGSRPAHITSLNPTSNSKPTSDAYTTAVTLGSMSGIYRARVPPHSSDSTSSPTAAAAAAATTTTTSTSTLNPNEELESNTIAKSKARKFTETQMNGRQAKELTSAELTRRRTGGSSSELSGQDFARSLALPSETNVKFLPKPVQVQSKVLYVERPDVSSLKSSRQQLPVSSVNSMSNTQHQSVILENKQLPVVGNLKEQSIESLAARGTHERDSRRLKQLARLKAEDELLADLQATPIIMTNNHRVQGDYLLPLVASSDVAQQQQQHHHHHHQHTSSTGRSAGDNNNDHYSIRYSAAKVDEYPFLSREHDVPILELNGSQMRSRTGRMRSSSSFQTESEKSEFTNSNSKLVTPPSSIWTVNRMGETLTDSSDLIAETSNETSNYTSLQQQQFNSSSSSTLAQNITSYLLKWSLKTLSNLARKSIESLIKSNESEFGSSTGSMLTEHQLLDLDLLTQNQPTNDQKRAYFSPTSTTTNQPLNLLTTTTRQADLTINSTSNSRQVDLGDQGSNLTDSIQLLTTSSTTLPSTSSKLPPIERTETEEKSMLSSDEVLDGFITNRRHKAEDGKTHSNNSSFQKGLRDNLRQQHSRPSNYSKSLDLNRGEWSLSLSRQRPNSEKSKVSFNIKQQQSTSPPPSSSSSSSFTSTAATSITEKDQPHYNESVWSNRDSFYSSWIFYAMLLFVALVSGIFLSFCLVSSPSSSSASQCFRQNRSSVDVSSIRPIAANCNLASSLALDSDCRIHHDSYQKYDYNKFENYSNETMNKRKKKETLLATEDKLNHLNKEQHSPSTMSQSTRTTSAASSASITMYDHDENDCKNNEFLYTEHVLINTGSSFGESYA